MKNKKERRKHEENTVTVGYLSLVDEQVNLDCSLPKAKGRNSA